MIRSPFHASRPPGMKPVSADPEKGCPSMVTVTVGGATAGMPGLPEIN